MTCIRRYEQHESFSDIEEFYMKRILIQYAVCALAVALMVPLARAQSQPAGLQAAFAKGAGTLSDKFTGLARVMSGKYDWKPTQGVRSVADVFNLIVKENGLLAGVLSGTPNTGAQPAPITDPGKLQEALKASYANLQRQDDPLGLVTFNYDFVVKDKVTNSGIEHWQVCKIDGQWKILPVVWTVYR